MRANTPHTHTIGIVCLSHMRIHTFYNHTHTSGHTHTHTRINSFSLDSFEFQLYRSLFPSTFNTDTQSSDLVFVCLTLLLFAFRIAVLLIFHLYTMFYFLSHIYLLFLFYDTYVTPSIYSWIHDQRFFPSSLYPIPPPPPPVCLSFSLVVTRSRSTGVSNDLSSTNSMDFCIWLMGTCPCVCMCVPVCVWLCVSVWKMKFHENRFSVG